MKSRLSDGSWEHAGSHRLVRARNSDFPFFFLFFFFGGFKSLCWSMAPELKQDIFAILVCVACLSQATRPFVAICSSYRFSHTCSRVERFICFLWRMMTVRSDKTFLKNHVLVQFNLPFYTPLNFTNSHVTACV